MDYTGIVFLLLGASAMSLLQITLRFSQNKGKNVMASIAANYFVAALVCAATIATSGGLSISPFTVYFGIIMGIMFMVGIVIITISFGQKGVALTSSVSQLAVLIPTFMSIFLWGESTSATQTVGILVAVASLPLLTMKAGESTSIDRTVLMITAANFFINGICQGAGKILLEAGYSSERTPFFLVLYISALLSSLPLVVKNGHRPTKEDLGFGSIVGALNALGNLAFVASLTLIPGSIAFPLYSAIGLLATVGLSIALLREKISRVNAIGIATCLAAVVLINA